MGSFGSGLLAGAGSILATPSAGAGVSLLRVSEGSGDCSTDDRACGNFASCGVTSGWRATADSRDLLGVEPTASGSATLLCVDCETPVDFVSLAAADDVFSADEPAE